MSNINEIFSKLKFALGLPTEQAVQILESTDREYQDSGPGGAREPAIIYKNNGPAPGSGSAKTYQDAGPSDEGKAFHNGMAKLAGKNGSDDLIKQLIQSLPKKPKLPKLADLKGFLSKKNGKPSLKMVNEVALEKQDPSHRMGGVLELLYDKYCAQGGASANQDFFEWVDKKSYFEIYKLMSDDGYGNQLSRDGARAFLTGVNYMNKAARAEYRVKIKDGLLMQGGEPFDSTSYSTMANRTGWAIWVMSPGGKLYTSDHKIGELHHSGFLGGANVRCAGEWKVRGGVIELASGKSGHYQPDVEVVFAGFTDLRKMGLNTGKSFIVLKPNGKSRAEKIPIDDFLKMNVAQRKGYTTWFHSSEAPYDFTAIADPAVKMKGMSAHRQG